MLTQLKAKFEATDSVVEKIHILSCGPQSWSNQRFVDFFGTSMYSVKKMRSLVNEQGILCKPKPTGGKRLSESTVKKIEPFYRQPDISRELAGKKEYKSVFLKSGKREHRQKRLVLGNLREIYTEFKRQHPNEKVRFSRFASLRPAECVLAGASGTHTGCVCVCMHSARRF